MTRYKDIPMSQRIEKIGDLLAKGVYLYIQKQKEVEKSATSSDDKNISQNGNAPLPSLCNLTSISFRKVVK